MYWHAIGHIHSLTFTQTHTRTYIYTYARTFPSFRCCNCTHTRAEVLANRQMPAGGRWLDHFFTSCDQSTVWLKHCLTKTLCDQNTSLPRVTKTLCCHFLCVLSLPMCAVTSYVCAVTSLPRVTNLSLSDQSVTSWPTCHLLTLCDQSTVCICVCVRVCVCVCMCVYNHARPTCTPLPYLVWPKHCVLSPLSSS